MFVEGEVEVAIKDSTFTSSEDYDLKVWLQRSFTANACYRISKLKLMPGRILRATVAVNTRILPEAEWKKLEQPPGDPGQLGLFLERAFTGKGTIKSVGRPALKAA